MKDELVKKILKLGEGTEPVIIEQRTVKNNSHSGDVITGFVQSSEIGFLIALPITLGALFGLWLDKKFHTQPKLMLSFLFLGVFLGFLNLYIIIKQYSRKDKK